MRPAALQALTTAALAAALAIGAGDGPAAAADAAKRSIIGFSGDGAYFAFEEYGVQDGSGFPYSNVYVIDNGADEWVPGSPYRALLQQNFAKLDAARAQSRNAASETLVRLGIGRQGKTVLSDPAEKLDAAARFLAFTVPDEGTAKGLGTVRLRVSEHRLARSGCAFPDLRGFTLQLEDADGMPLRILHEDKEIPPSRGCPRGYGLSDVIVFPRDGRGPVLIVVVSVYRYGFEGFDRRYIGIAATFEKNPQEGRGRGADPAPAPAAQPTTGKAVPKKPARERKPPAG